MVMLGKLITHEFAFGIQFPGHRFPPARNPWNVDHIPGGSSSGSGAALAAGLTVGALGSDTGGSIRGPAAFCGIAGLKPTYGRVSRAGVVTLSWTLDHTGPMARSAEDCAFMLQALAGHDPADPASAREPVADYLASLEGGVKGLRVGVVRDYFFEQVEPETVAAFERALAELGRLGATVRDVTIPSIHATPSFMVIMLTEAFAYHERDLRAHPELYGDVLREKLMAGGLFRADEYVQAQRLRAQIREDTARALAVGGRADHAHRARSRARLQGGARPGLPVRQVQHGPVQHHRAADPGAADRLLRPPACRCRSRSPAGPSTRPPCCARATPTSGRRTGTVAARRCAHDDRRSTGRRARRPEGARRPARERRPTWSPRRPPTCCA